MRDRRTLHEAARDGDFDMVESLINQGADLEQLNQDGWTPLSLAASRGHLETVWLLLERGANLEHQVKHHGWAPLSMAASNGHAETAQLLLDRGATIDRQDIYGETPLLVAAKRAKLNVVRLLLDRGANIDLPGIGGNTPLAIASFVRFFHRDKLQILQLLLERGADIDHKNIHGQTPLHEACSSQNGVEVLQALLDRGPNLELQDNNGETPLLRAIRLSILNKTRLLLERGANVYHCDSKGRTPLYYALGDGEDLELVYLLVQAASQHGDGVAHLVTSYLSHNPETIPKMTMHEAWFVSSKKRFLTKKLPPSSMKRGQNLNLHE